MNPNVDDIVAQVQRLSPTDRELLFMRLQVEVTPAAADPAIAAAWIVEAERRLDAVDRGEMATVPWDVVRRDMGLT